MKTRLALTSVILFCSLSIAACAPRSSVVERYVSHTIQGQKQRINLDAVQDAFFSTSGKDFNSWMSAFEKRVNEIYEGTDVVSIDATRQSGKLLVTGYIDKQHKQGFVDGDEKLFTIEQTGDAVNNQMPCRVADQYGNTYWQGNRSILDNPFLQMMLISHFMNGWGGRYYTPYDRYSVLQTYRTDYRATPQWSRQQTANQGFFSRFKTNPTNGNLRSTSGFGTTMSSGSPLSNRSFSGASTGSGSFGNRSGSSSSWGGMRRSAGFSSRGWGGFRRR